MQINDFVEAQKTFAKLSPKTIEGYQKDLRAFERFGNGEFTLEAVQGYVAELRRRNRSSNHISRVLYALKRYATWAGIEKLFGEGRVELPLLEVGTIEPEDVLTEEDVGKLINHARTPLEQTIIALLFDTGMRIGEMLNMKAEDVDWNSGELRIRRKGRRGRVERTAVYPQTLEYLKEYRQWRGIKKGGDLFPYDYGELRIWIIGLAKRANVKFPRYSLFHNLRHARAVTDRLVGFSVEDVSDTLGHRSLTTTAKLYSRLTPQQMLKRRKPPPWEEKRDD